MSRYREKYHDRRKNLHFRQTIYTVMGIFFIIAGIYLGVWKNLLLFFSSLMLCSFFGLALFLWGWFQGKDYRKKRLPFLMFTLPMGFYLAWM